MLSNKVRQCFLGLCIVLITLLTACAGNIPAAPKDQRAEYDPWEPLNRRISNFNHGFDRVTLRPLAKGYDKVMPGFVKTGVGNFSDNLWGPRNIINNLLQGKAGRSGVELARFLTNTIVGIGGLFDVATASELEAYPETFGQTFSVWGIPDGPFVVIPILGPRTLVGAVGIPFNFLSDPLWHVDDSTVKWIIYGIRLIDIRTRLFPAESLIEGSYDRYLTVRESFLQNWRFRVYDGDPPEDDDFYDEFLDEEEE